MKTDKYFLLIAIFAVILCGSVMGERELPETDYGRGLIGRAEPALAGIEQLAVVIVPPEAEPSKDNVVWKNLQAKLIDRLNKTGIKITAGVAGDILNIVELRVDIDMLKLEDSQQYVFHIQTSLSRAVCLAEEHRLFFKADVWNAEPIMQTVPVENMPEKVTSVVLEQAEVFIHAYMAANPKGVESTKDNDVSADIQKRVGPIAKPAVAEHKYVASKNSKVFHKLDCSSAERIKPKNRIFYNSRGEAIQSGRRPCKLCKP